jgi:lysophosphatidylcholine acyltransferase/lyso-PAF acetyltransferase
LATTLCATRAALRRALSQQPSSVLACAMTDLHAKYAPFARRDAYGPMGCSVRPAEKLRLLLVWCTLLPVLKAVAALAVLVSFALVCTTLRALAPPRLRRALLPTLAYLHVRAVLFCFGFLWIRVRRLGPPPRPGAPAPVCLVSNHVSWADILVFMALEFPSFVAKATIRKLPLVGVIRRVFSRGACVCQLWLFLRALADSSVLRARGLAARAWTASSCSARRAWRARLARASW